MNKSEQLVILVDNEWVSDDDDDEDSINLVTSRACSSNPEYRPLMSVRYNMSHVDMVYLREDGRYLHTSPDDLAAALSRDDLGSICEEDVYELLLDWVYYDLESRRPHFGLLFGSLRLPYVPKSYVDKIIRTESLVRDDPSCYTAVVQFDRLHEKLAQGVSSATRMRYEHVIGAPRISYKNMQIMVCGGKKTEDLCEIYNPETNTWAKIRSIPEGRSSAGVFVSPDRTITFIGGEDSLKNHVVSSYKFHVDTGEWSDGIVAPGQCRTGGMCCMLDGKVYLAGGLTTEDGYTTSVERFNPESKRWVPVKAMETPRFGYGCVVLDGFIYVCGGFNGERDLTSAAFFMPDANEWTSIAPMNTARSGCKLVTAEGKLFCVGGWDGQKILNTGEMYDPRSNRWTPIAPMNRQRHGLELISIGNLIYAIGGWNGRKPLSSIERYHTRSDEWELLKPMSVGRWLTTAVALPTANAH